jgi:hypothetical protein
MTELVNQLNALFSAFQILHALHIMSANFRPCQHFTNSFVFYAKLGGQFLTTELVANLDPVLG